MTLKLERRLAKDSSVIVVDLYQVPRGRVLRLDVQSVEALGRLRTLFHDLSEHKVREISLASLDFIAFSQSVKDIVLKLIQGGREPSQTIKLASDGPTGAIFVWARHSEGWLECAELLDGLTQPGHQYLSRGARDDAEVEVSFQEPTP
jgi:hypothetical protein